MTATPSSSRHITMLAYSLLFSIAITVAAAKLPNVVFILADDMGQWAAGAYGNEEITLIDWRLKGYDLTMHSATLRFVRQAGRATLPVAWPANMAYTTGLTVGMAATTKALLTHTKRLRTRMCWPRTDTRAELAGNITLETSRWPSTHLRTGLSTSRGWQLL